MLSSKWAKLAAAFILTASFAGQNIASTTTFAEAGNQSAGTSGTGKWMAGEYHAHTYVSDDAQQSVQTVLDQAFETYGMDWMNLSDHLRTSKRDEEGNSLPSPISFTDAVNKYQVNIINKLKDAGKYKDKIIFSGFEWDMPTYDHVGAGILADSEESSLKATSLFEYLYTDRPESMFDPAAVAEWKLQYPTRPALNADTARDAVKWLKTNYADSSYMIINHPSRKLVNGNAIFRISDIRDFNNIAPNIFFGMEGMPGNQMEPDRAGLNQNNPKTKTYGGSDYMIAKVGGVWDALLGEGRRFWNFTNSDSHFKVSQGLYSSGYAPGEYSKNYSWVEGNDMAAVLDGMRSGKSFSTTGDLINALDFTITNGANKGEMGQNLKVKDGDALKLTIRFKSPQTNNYAVIKSENPAINDKYIYQSDVTNAVKVDHVDLIAGDVTGEVKPGTDEYNKDTNDSTKVIARFTSEDWTTDAEGYNVITYDLDPAYKDQYFRLRGTNLGENVAGETENGETLIDVRTEDDTTIEDLDIRYMKRFNEINDRNYKDLWFYSNPIFVTSEPKDDGNTGPGPGPIVTPPPAPATSVEVDLDALKGIDGAIKDVISFNVPAGAAAVNGKISAKVVGANEAPSAGTLEALSPVVEFQSTAGNHFNKPVEISFNYKKDQVQSGKKAAIYYYNELQKRWIYVGGTVKADGTISAKVNHFTKFAVFQAEAKLFSDATTHWVAPFADRLLGMNVIQGFEDGTFHPEEKVTRAAFAKMIVQALGLPAASGTASFADNSDIPAWAGADVAAAVQAGILKGYEQNGKTLFKPNQTITRAEMSVMIANALKANEQQPASAEMTFKDAAAIPAWAKDSINRAVSEGIITGYTDLTFRSDRAASRAEAAAMIFRLLDRLHI